jgi:hypothetical protein
MKRIMRLAVVLLPVLGMLAMTAAPANALGAGVIVFEGTATTGAGFGGPCSPQPTPPNVPPDLSKCPVVGSGNSVSLNFGGTGVGVVGTAAKTKCATACVEAGTVNISASGSINGWCGDAAGALSGSVTPALALGTKSKSRLFTVTFTALGATVVIQGSTDKGEIIAGAAVSAFNVAADTTACTTKDQHSFLIAGAAVLINATA